LIAKVSICLQKIAAKCAKSGHNFSSAYLFFVEIAARRLLNYRKAKQNALETGGNMNTVFPKLIIEERVPKSIWLVTKTREEYFQLKAFLREIATINEDRSGFNAMQPPRFVRKLE